MARGRVSAPGVLEGTTAKLGTVAAELTAFTVRVRTSRGVDLVGPPFEAFRATIASPSDYAATQAIGEAMRTAGVDAFRYPSARDPNRGVNVGILTPSAFGRAQPREFSTWWCTATTDRVELIRRDYLKAGSFVFERRQFVVRGRLPAPAW